MTLAIGGCTSISTGTQGELWANVLAYGAKPDGSTDCSAAFQNAIDDLALKLDANPGSTGVVFVPSSRSPYNLNSTLWLDHDGIAIRGEGWGSQLRAGAGVSHTLLQLGVKRVETKQVGGSAVPVTIDSRYRPDLYGKLDASAVSAPGTRWGLRTNQDAYAVFCGTPLSGGPLTGVNPRPDNWGSTSKLTLEFCFEPPDGQSLPTFSPLMGLGTRQGAASPFIVSTWDDPKKLCVMFRTSDCDVDNAQHVRSFQFRLGTATPPYRVAIQIDLDSAACSAFVNGVQATLEGATNLDATANSVLPFIAGSGTKFLRNEYYPFLIGAEGVSVDLVQSTQLDLRVYGLRLSTALRYRNDGVGQPQRRVDFPGTALTDGYAYFGNDQNTLAFLAATVNPTTAGRTIGLQLGTTTCGGGVASGVILNAGVSTRVSNIALNNLVVSSGTSYGTLIGLGNLKGAALTGIEALGGYQAAGAVGSHFGSDVFLSQCVLQGADAAISGSQQSIQAENIVIPRAGRACVRLIGCDSTIRGISITALDTTSEAVVKYHGWSSGGSHALRDLRIDDQSLVLSQCVIFAESHLGSKGASLALQNLSVGSIGPFASAIRLRDRTADPSQAPSRIIVRGFRLTGSDVAPLVDIDGPFWLGEVSDSTSKNMSVVHRQKWGTSGRIIVRDSSLVAPPRTGSYWRGCHVLSVTSPAEGQYAEWRCVKSGPMGTNSPPRWIGVRPIRSAPPSLAGYVLNQAYFNAAIN